MSNLLALEKDSAKRDRNLLAQVLMQAGAKNAARNSLCCPFHDDKHPSAGIKQAPTGFWYFHCYVCDINEDVWALRARIEGRDVGDILKEANPMRPVERAKQPERAPETFATIDDLITAYRERNPRNDVAEINRYTDPESGEFDFATIRIHPDHKPEDKTFRQVSKTDGRWLYSGLKGRLPLFNRTRLKEVERVLIVEGEKCVRAVTALGASNLAATTSPGGAQAGSKADWSPVAGKRCYIWRDNDESGLKYEADVIAALMKLDPPVLVYRVRVEELELKRKEDVVNYLDDEAMTNAEKVGAVELCLHDAEPLNVTSALDRKIDKIISGEFRAVPFPQKPITSDYSKAIMPGCLTTIVGEPGAGKSFFILEDFWRWSVQKKESVKLMMLEDDHAFHQQRALAQMSGYPGILDPDWVAVNPERSKQIVEHYRPQLEFFARHLEVSNGQMTLTEIAQWIINHAENGVRVIGVDPITAAKASDKPWVEDQRFLFEVKPVLERTGASLVLTTHPRIGQAGKPSLSGIAGGASYPRFSQCVFWLRELDKPKEIKVWDGYGTKFLSHRQVLQIRKARNGRGQGKHVAVNLNFDNLCFDELGAIEATDE